MPGMVRVLAVISSGTLAFGRLLVDDNLFGPFPSHFGRDFSQKFLFYLVRVDGFGPEVDSFIIGLISWSSPVNKQQLHELSTSCN